MWVLACFDPLRRWLASFGNFQESRKMCEFPKALAPLFQSPVLVCRPPRLSLAQTVLLSPFGQPSTSYLLRGRGKKREYWSNCVYWCRAKCTEISPPRNAKTLNSHHFQNKLLLTVSFLSMFLWEREEFVLCFIHYRFHVYVSEYKPEPKIGQNPRAFLFVGNV